MTPQPPSLEDLLRERLHAVDELTPPDTNFEARALRVGRARANRRRSWARGLVGVAAAAAIGVFVVPSVMRSSVNSGGSAASSAQAAATAVAPAPSSAVGADRSPEPPGASSTKMGPDGSLLKPENQSGGDVTLTLPVGTTPFDWRSADGEARLAQLRAALAAPEFAASQTSLRIDDSTSPARLMVRMGIYEAGIVTLVTNAFPRGSPIVFSVAAG